MFVDNDDYENDMLNPSPHLRNALFWDVRLTALPEGFLIKITTLARKLKMCKVAAINELCVHMDVTKQLST